jgi:hypothetical protein
MVIRWYNNTVSHAILKGFYKPILYYNTSQRLPLGIVTTTPDAIVEGPTDEAEYPDGIE